MAILPAHIRGAYYPQRPLLMTSRLNQGFIELAPNHVNRIGSCPPEQAALLVLPQFSNLECRAINNQQTDRNGEIPG